MIKRLFFLASCFLIFACTSTKYGGGSIYGRWELSVFPYSGKTFFEVFGDSRPDLELDRDGKISGTTGCNKLSGGYKTEGEQFAITGPLAMTKMACPGNRESLFLEALSKINRFKASNTELRFFQDSTLLMTLVKR